MLKHLFLGLTMSATLLAAAEDQTQTPPESTPSNPLDDILVTEKVINDAVEILESIDGYIFLEIGQTRDLSNTFSRTDELFSGLDDESKIQELDFEIKNDDIAIVDEKGKVTGYDYGQTLLIVSDSKDIIQDGDKKENYYFIVLVCPTISIITPDGVVYKHQKIYNQKTKVDFTHSANFAINSVMANYNNGEKVYDITDKIDSNGHYESEVNISRNVIYTVTLEEDPEDNLLGKSPYRILVDNGNIWFALADSGLKGDETDEQKADKLESDLKEMTIVTSTPKNRGTAETPNMGEVQVYTTSNGEKIDFSGSMPKYTAPFNDGVYFLTLTIGDKSYKYKIVLNR